MRIAIIADTYPPLKISGAVQMRDLVAEFAAQGHEPVVIVPASDLAEPWKIERTGSVTVLRVRTPPTKRVNYVRRTINELRLPYVLLRAMGRSGLRKLRFDGIVWYSPTIFLGPIIKRLRRESGCRSYLILRDIFPEWAVDMGLMSRSPAYWFFKWIEREQYSVADTIGVQTEANRPYMSKWAKARPGRALEVLQNWLSPAPSVGCSIDVSKTKLAGRTIFVYAGNMGVAQGMDVFIELAVRMRGRKDIGFLYVGGGSDTARFAATVEREGLDNVLFHKEIEPTEITGLLEQCHVGVVALDPRHKSHNIPGKFLTYMQAGIPVLARINPHNDLESLINDERVGKVCTGGDAATLQRLVEELVADRDMLDGAKERGRALWMRLFSTKAAVEQIVRSIEAPRSRSVLILNQFFYPDVSATAQHAFDLARFLRRNGDEVSAIAWRSSYGQSGSAAGGKLDSEETVDGIRIHRVGSSLLGKRGLVARAIDFMAFNVACLFKALTLPRHDVVICLTTPPFIALIGLVLRWLKGSKFVFWTMDLYPEVPLAAGVIKRGSITHRVFDALDRFCLRQADAVVVLGRCMRELVLRKGVDPAKVTTITPWADPDEVRSVSTRGNSFREEWGIGDRFVIEYSGNCGIGHDVSSVCQAMYELRDDDQIRWVFVGGGVTRPRIEEFVAKHGIRNVIMKPYQPRERLGDLISLGDAHLVLVADGFEGLLLPSKFYGVMAAGRPTVYVGPAASEVARVIAEEKCGFAVANGDCAALVRAIRDLQSTAGRADTMGARGREALERAYSTRIGCSAWQQRIHGLSTARRA